MARKDRRKSHNIEKENSPEESNDVNTDDGAAVMKRDEGQL